MLDIDGVGEVEIESVRRWAVRAAAARQGTDGDQHHHAPVRRLAKAPRDEAPVHDWRTEVDDPHVRTDGVHQFEAPLHVGGVATIALANKIARMAWAIMARGERYKEPVALAA